ncbi:MAG: recombinase RecQ [Bacteroidetes bacterium RIFOXYA12_FULL_35_11]|nr:MAG: recombinase RecQ [Bacteroidetes bacterium GWF2_35_48]OFY81956.1 MAG: recombinase RecQ [Bacteroidetes bacterium RIFOXYA12_FULL_35_11]OFY95722.1 MAG: recombinase RecQ [Bacteroidetes bacterium RIFOXYC12_FULL_35_7]HBX52194.1 RecQ family ATP-dependent DNA helicase [Bacteroidales bacterium]
MDRYRQILTRYWGYPNFRPLQEDIIRSVAEGKDTLGLLPTGGGKSVIFQVYALSVEGICIVVTPLIALMKDQVENLKKRDIKAVAIHSGLSSHEIDIQLNNCVFGDIKFLYVSPERLDTEMFRQRVVSMPVNLLAIDEAHCISQWGYDFRPSYLKIANLRELLPGIPVLALTATATPDVVNDIQEKLMFKTKNLFKMSFERKNLVYIVRNVEDKTRYLQKILTQVNGSAVVYVRSRVRTKELAEFLIKNSISADYFHAGLSNEIRDTRQADWKKGKTRVIVSTNAFGMGIDKPDVRVVVHIDLPDSLEAYFQEAGRAGRDEKKAYAVLLYDGVDKKRLEKSMTDNFPEISYIKNVYNAIGNFYKVPVGGGKGLSFDFNVFDICKAYQLQAVTVLSSLKILQCNGYLEVTDEINAPSRILFIVNRDDLYKFQVLNAQFDGFIKLLLRSYTGVFNDYTPIDELALATKSKTTQEIIYKYLVKLQSLHIIKYNPRKNTPSIFFLEERLDDKNLFISKESYYDRKERYEKRVASALMYANGTTKCRSQVLLSYFGDTESFRCGQCDICVRRNKLDLSKLEFDAVLEQIKKILKLESLLLDDLVDRVSTDEDKVLKVVQWLLDNNKILRNDEHRLEWHSHS